MERFKPIIRLATAFDAENICALFNRVSPEYDRGTDFWLWINRFIGKDNSIVVIVEFQEQVVGHYAIIPGDVVLDDKKYQVGFGIHAVIESEVNNLVSIFEVTNLAYKKAKELGFKFIYGFPNENYRLIQQKIERWHQIGLFNANEIDINKYLVKSDVDKYQVEKLTDSNDSILSLAKTFDTKVNSNTKCYFEKSFLYYVNRYIKHPHKLYDSFLIKDKEGNSTIIFLKKFKDKKLLKGHIIDFIRQEKFSSEKIIDISVHILKQEKVNLLSFWHVDKEIKQIFENRGLEPKGFNTFFGLKFLDKDFKKAHQDLLLDFDNWTLMMGDSDAF
ncbi:hypothetical protein [Aquimarina sp. LLG6339-5]|uniref:hypothetical protein n=1 Tax=Aquimarina sp. LLG6339-5 TaxID=3160830 RepID=UPI00386C5E68